MYSKLSILPVCYLHIMSSRVVMFFSVFETVNVDYLKVPSKALQPFPFYCRVYPRLLDALSCSLQNIQELTVVSVVCRGILKFWNICEESNPLISIKLNVKTVQRIEGFFLQSVQSMKMLLFLYCSHSPTYSNITLFLYGVNIHTLK